MKRASLFHACTRGILMSAILTAPVFANDLVHKNFGNLPLVFERNQGQTDQMVDFLARGPGYTLYLTSEGAVFSLKGSEGRGWSLRMNILGANKQPRLEGLDRQPAVANYFIGNDSQQWRTHIPTYSRVKYAEVYSGVDLVYYANQGQVEYDFIVAPGVSPSRIRLEFEGAESIRVEKGELVVATSQGDLVQHRPIIYQPSNGGRREIAGEYMLLAENRVGFHVEEYDRSQPLVIDPTIVYSTYLGGSGTDVVNEIEVDAAGSIYAAGVTTSINFPTTAGAFDTTQNGAFDAFVSKLDPSGTTLLYSTYIGGSGQEMSDGDFLGLAIDGAGNAYLTVDTASPDYPTTAGAFDTTYNGGGTDQAVTKLDPAGSALVYSTFVGGMDIDRGGGDIEVDAAGNAYVCGASSSADFPVTLGVVGPLPLGGDDAVAYKLDPSGSSLLYSTYLGGSNVDTCLTLEIDAAGNAYLGGNTRSTDFPLTAGAPDTTKGGPRAGFVTKLNPAATALVFSTYVSGSGNESLTALGLDAANNVYAGGHTTSADFPVVSPFQAAFAGGSDDAFLTRINAAGTAFDFSTYLGGNDNDRAPGDDLIVDAAGRTYLYGFTDSADFPTTPDAISTVRSGVRDGFLTIFDASGSAIDFSTYFGGTDREVVDAVAIDASGDVYLGGNTNSIDFPTAPVTPLQGTLGGTFDGFVAKLSGLQSNQPPVADAGPDQTAVECANPAGTAVTLDGSLSSDPDGDALTYTWSGPFPEGGGMVTGVSPVVTLPLGGPHVITLVVNDGTVDSGPDTVEITVVDTTPPAISVAAENISLWPPNHQYHTVSIGDFLTSVSDDCDTGLSAADVVITSVSSDEPEDVGGGGDGNTLNDIVIAGDCRSVNLRSERQGGGNGRVYTIQVAVSDASGNSAAASFQVEVPHNENATAVDNGQAYSVSGCTP